MGLLGTTIELISISSDKEGRLFVHKTSLIHNSYANNDKFESIKNESKLTTILPKFIHILAEQVNKSQKF